MVKLKIKYHFSSIWVFMVVFNHMLGSNIVLLCFYACCLYYFEQVYACGVPCADYHAGGITTVLYALGSGMSALSSFST